MDWLINLTYYCMSKAALDIFTKCLSVELATFGIWVNSVNPRIVTTNIQYRAGFDGKWYQNLLEKTKTTHSIGRHGEVEEVASLITLLASIEASFNDRRKPCCCWRWMAAQSQTVDRFSETNNWRRWKKTFFCVNIIKILSTFLIYNSLWQKYFTWQLD